MRRACILFLMASVLHGAPKERSLPDLWKEIDKRPDKPRAMAAIETLWGRVQAQDSPAAFRQYVDDVQNHSYKLVENGALLRKAYEYAGSALEGLCRHTMREPGPQPFLDLIAFIAGWGVSFKDVQETFNATQRRLVVSLYEPLWDRTRAANTIEATTTFLNLLEGKTKSPGGFTSTSTFLAQAWRDGPEAARVAGIAAQGTALLAEQRWAAISRKEADCREAITSEYAGDPYGWLSPLFDEFPDHSFSSVAFTQGNTSVARSTDTVGAASIRLEPPRGLLYLTNALVLWKACRRFAFLHLASPRKVEAAALADKLEEVMWTALKDDVPTPFLIGFASMFASSPLAAKARAALEAREDADWEKARQPGTIEGLSQFLRMYPETRHAGALKLAALDILKGILKGESPQQSTGIPLLGPDAGAHMPKETPVRRTSANMAVGDAYAHMLHPYRWLAPQDDVGGVVRGMAKGERNVAYAPQTLTTLSSTRSEMSAKGNRVWTRLKDLNSKWTLEFPRHEFAFVFLAAGDYNRTDLPEYLEARFDGPDVAVEVYPAAGSPLVLERECPDFQRQLVADGLPEDLAKSVVCAERLRYVSGSGVVIVKTKSERRVYGFGL